MLTPFSFFPLALSGPKGSIVTDSRQVRLATGIFPVISLLNHSCNPNTSVSFISTVATIRASQRIRKGQEILHCYGEPSLRTAILPFSNRKGQGDASQQATRHVTSPVYCLLPGRGSEHLGQKQGREDGRKGLRARALLRLNYVSLFNHYKLPILKMG